MSGPILLHGIPGCGKSTRARELAARASKETGWPILVHDPARAKVWADLPHAETLDEALQALYKRRDHVAYSTNDPPLVDRLAAALLECGGAVFVLDELRVVSTAHSAPRNLVLLARQWRHAGGRGVRLLMLTQRINDCAGDLISACARIDTGRCSAPRILDYLESEFALGRAQVQALPRGEFISTSMGFHE